MNNNIAVVILALITLGFIFYVDGGINGFSIWNSIPILIGLIVLLVDKSVKGLKYAVYGFAYTIIISIFAVHVGYLIDIGAILSKPALTGQKLYGLPVYSIGAGYIVGMVGVVVGAVKEHKSERRNDKSP